MIEISINSPGAAGYPITIPASRTWIRLSYAQCQGGTSGNEGAAARADPPASAVPAIRARSKPAARRRMGDHLRTCRLPLPVLRMRYR